MKNRSISFYILAMVLATGSNAQASDYVLSKDNTHVATTALKYKTKRPLLQGIRNEIRFLASFNRQKAFCIKSCRGNH